ncbi:hypothetical protein PEBR_38956 [Penicillium brasilianum]|uniref:Uncharacterized protein n=1 Tax=Penicillium brasilianum TaxID=104259 RepID=A0A1S9RAJ1_PENBI|nr:hypothetical protein PEBR_38956 [Penicillium brasilianum]
MCAGFALNDPSQFQTIENPPSQNIYGPTTQNIDCISPTYGDDEHTTNGRVEQTSTHQVHEKAESDFAIIFSTEASGCSNMKPGDELCLEDGKKRYCPQESCCTSQV